MYRERLSTKNPEKIKTHVTAEETAYWAEFYANTDFNKGSSFHEFIKFQKDVPSTIVDIGCGQGRDSFAFAQAGKTVIGLDRSEVGVSHASEKARIEGLDTSLAFATCDVSDTEDLYAKLSVAREASPDSLCYYMRFFLHSIPEDTQEKLLQTVAAHSQPGDVFTAEFRTDKDENLTKTFGDSHYRRYQNAEIFSQKLQNEYGWGITFETEENGLSPYKGEDPILYRVIATK